MNLKDSIDKIKKTWPVKYQHELASVLAANCGYKLVAEDTERSLEIKELIKAIKESNSFEETELHYVIQGLEGLLK